MRSPPIAKRTSPTAPTPPYALTGESAGDTKAERDGAKKWESRQHRSPDGKSTATYFKPAPVDCQETEPS